MCKPVINEEQNCKNNYRKGLGQFFHIEAIPGVKADNPYFVVAVKETQRCGNEIVLSFLLCCTHFSLRH
jgi:hypothetical protein